MQVIGREAAAVAAQLVHCGLVRRVARIHGDMMREPSALEQIAGRTRRHHIVPRRLAATGARHQVIECQIVARAAILAFEAVAQKHVEPGERRVARGLHVGLERDHARQLHLEARRMHHPLIFGEDIHPLEEDGLDSVLPAP